MWLRWNSEYWQTAIWRAGLCDSGLLKILVLWDVTPCCWGYTDRVTSQNTSFLKRNCGHLLGGFWLPSPSKRYMILMAVCRIGNHYIFLTSPSATCIRNQIMPFDAQDCIPSCTSAVINRHSWAEKLLKFWAHSLIKVPFIVRSTGCVFSLLCPLTVLSSPVSKCCNFIPVSIVECWIKTNGKWFRKFP